jgi:segregation and condensation protein B
MDISANERKKALSALLFASSEPLSLKQISSFLDSKKKHSPDIWKTHLDEIREDILATSWGIELREHAGGYQLVTQNQFFPFLKTLNQEAKIEKLSIAACEVLALLAIQNQMTRSQIEQARGVDSAAVIQSLIEKSMVEIKGKASGPTGAALYGISEGFYKHFNLQDKVHLKKLYESSLLEKV